MSDQAGTAPAIVVENPPKSVHKSRKRTDWEQVLEQVRAQGGEWCRVGQFGYHGLASRMRAWLKQSRLSVGFEVCTRRVTLPDGTKVARLYARYIPA